MPIPVGATMIASIAHFSPRPVGYAGASRWWSLSFGPHLYATALVVLVICLAFLMISTLRYSSFKNVGVGNRNPRILIIAIALMVTLIWFYSRWVLLIVATIYASHGVLLKLWSFVKPRRSEAEKSEFELDTKAHT
jgi:CDP-diacylglycerol--serine O-phosphatidyltransferase